MMLIFINCPVDAFYLAQERSPNCHGRSISAERVFAGKFSCRKPTISSITAFQMLLKADLLSQSTTQCRQMLWSCADLLQADWDLAAASSCGTGKFSFRKHIISSITAWQLLLEFDTYDNEINATCKILFLNLLGSYELFEKLWC